VGDVLDLLLADVGKLAAIFAADVAGYSRLMARDA
jgi:hypothetical protein